MTGFLKEEIWGMKSGCCGLLNRTESRGFPTAGEQGFDSLHSHVPEQSTAKTPGATLGERKG